MANIYNKTALKKIKKDELIQMFLDLQAEKINDSMDEEEKEPKCLFMYKAKIRELRDEVEGLRKRPAYASVIWERDCLKEENEKLNRELDDWHKALNEDVEGLEHLQSGINLHFWQRCSGPWDADIEKINQK